ncbi:MAG: hypothetical protein ACNA7W_12620 [Pseudomonadales bacterium]
MKKRDDLLHDLSDRLNGIMISVELVLRLLEGRDSKDVAQILGRVRDDCVASTELLNGLRDVDADD